MLWDSLPLLFVGALLIWVLYAFVREKWSPDIVAAIAVAALLVTQLLTPGEVLSVLWNSAPVTIACMFVISAALERTGCIDALGNWLGELVGTSPIRILTGLTVTALVSSACRNNTPLVDIITPVAIAQHALRQAKVLGDNVVSGMRGFPQKEYSHANKGAVAGLGLHKGVAMIDFVKMKIKLKGRLAWYMHRAYHGMAMPTWNRKIRVFADWTLQMFLKREVVSLGAIESPREEFYEAAKPAPAPAAAAPRKTEEKAKAS